jgi:predicted alpha/beta-hydrolase family hydrolase
MATVANALGARGVATLRYQFPYMQRGSKRTDPPRLCHATVGAAAATALGLAPTLPLFAGGKSFGGRMTSQAQAMKSLPAVRGLVFLGFPLHPPGKPGDARAEHLKSVHLPMLFLQGTRDQFADLTFLRPLGERLGERATLQLFPGADHSFHVRARSGEDTNIESELADAIARWIDRVATGVIGTRGRVGADWRQD